MSESLGVFIMINDVYIDIPRALNNLAPLSFSVDSLAASDIVKPLDAKHTASINTILAWAYNLSL